jgi:branched-chain amino acid transport system substrate-binding protein
LVHPDGRIDEVHGAAAGRLVRANADLAEYASALLRTGRDRVAFYWQGDEGPWFRVTIERRTRTHEADAATVTASQEPLPHAITGRELDVLTLLAGGLNNREIADRLSMGARTVATHIEHLLMKLSQRTRAGAVAVAVDQGLLRLPVPGDGEDLAGLTVGSLERSSGGPPVPVSQVRMTTAARRPLLIGSVLPLTGPARCDGLEMRNGTALAIGEINERGGVAGRRLEHVVVPADIFDPSSVRTAFDALTEAEVDAITSLYVFCEDTAMDRASTYGAPFLHAMASEHLARRTSEDPGRYSRVFQVCPSEVHYGRGFVRFLDGLGARGAWRPRHRSVLFIETLLESAQMATPDTLDCADRSGWRVAGVHHVAAQGARWVDVVDVIHRTDPDAILVTDFLPEELAGFQRAFAAAPTEALVYAVYSPSVPEFLELAGEAAEGLLWSTVTGTYGDPVGQRFVTRYARAHGRPPGRSHAGIAYDEVHLLAQAWAAVDNPRDFRSVADRLRTLRYRGVNGAYVMDNERQIALAYPDATNDPSLSQAHLVLQVQHGEHRIVDPPPYVETAFRNPPWRRPEPISA